MAAFAYLPLAGGCGREAADPARAPGAASPAKTPAEAAPATIAEAAPAAPPAGEAGSLRKIAEEEYPHLHNLMQVSEEIYSGSEPHGEEAFAELVRLGVKTVVSVDGARPNVEAAEKHGLHYVHIPIGYDGVPAEAGASFAQLVRTADGPFYIHCHHGQHRGPAAAAVACIAAGERDGRQALKILELAGTSRDYPGLWRDVERYTRPPADAPLRELVSVAEVGSMAAAMAQIDRSSDNLKLIAANQWRPLAGHPDLAPAQEALLLKEGLVEAERNLSDGYDQQFRDWMRESAAAASCLEAALKQDDRTAADEHFQALSQTCKKCHAEYRN